jgi:flagella basal body P-ring formation protein FlgA
MKYSRATAWPRLLDFTINLCCALAALALTPGWAAEPDPLPGGMDSAVWRQIQDLSERSTAGFAAGQARVEISTGQLDPRLKLAPCERIEAYLPAGARAWGRSRVGLRCTQGPSAWNVSLPITVKVFAPALVVHTALPAGTVLQATHLQEAEVDWAAERSPALADPAKLLGRTLGRALSAGAAVRQADLKQQLWFAAGDTVQVVARGAGFSVSGVGLALAPGVEGQPVRVRTDSGRVLSGLPVAANRVEVQL